MKNSLASPVNRAAVPAAARQTPTLTWGCAACPCAGRSLDETVDDVKEVPPIQRGVSSLVSKLSSRGSGGSYLGKYEPPAKPLADGQAPSAHL